MLGILKLIEILTEPKNMTLATVKENNCEITYSPKDWDFNKSSKQFLQKLTHILIKTTDSTRSGSESFTFSRDPVEILRQPIARGDPSPRRAIGSEWCPSSQRTTAPCRRRYRRWQNTRGVRDVQDRHKT